MRTMAIVAFTTLIGTPSLSFDLSGADNIQINLGGEDNIQTQWIFGSSAATPTNCTLIGSINNVNGGNAYVYTAGGITIDMRGERNGLTGQVL
mgnify:CR=1 FL=1